MNTFLCGDDEGVHKPTREDAVVHKIKVGNYCAGY